MGMIIDNIIKTNNMGDQTYEKDIVIPKVRYTKAIEALHKLCFYEEENTNRDNKLITFIN